MRSQIYDLSFFGHILGGPAVFRQALKCFGIQGERFRSQVGRFAFLIGVSLSDEALNRQRAVSHDRFGMSAKPEDELVPKGHKALAVSRDSFLDEYLAG